MKEPQISPHKMFGVFVSSKCVCTRTHAWMHGGNGFSTAACSRLLTPKSGAVRNPPTDSFYGDDNSSQTSMCESTHRLTHSPPCVNQGVTGETGPYRCEEEVGPKVLTGWFKELYCKINLSMSLNAMCVWLRACPTVSVCTQVCMHWSVSSVHVLTLWE